MCGIFGIWHLDGKAIDLGAVQRATNTLRHRGPDDEGYLLANTQSGRVLSCVGRDSDPRLGLLPIEDFYGETFDLALGFRRLSILDLSPAGHQPMTRADGRFWIIHDGEIYNYEELRKELMARGHQFCSAGSAEVVLHAYDEWGKGCLDRFNGIWAFVIWDATKKMLFCCRDRFGVKPLYYCFDGQRFVFGSEIKALLQAQVRAKANDRAIYDYLAHGLVDHSEETFFADVKCLPAGHYLRLGLAQKALETTRYYQVPASNRLTGLKDEEYAKQFYEIFEDAVRVRLIGDAPWGALLSGGLDSSSIVCVVDKLLSDGGISPPHQQSVQKTFSTRYEDHQYDEGRFIEEVASKTSIDSCQVYPKADDLLRQLDLLIWHQEQPFMGTSIYAQWTVFELARQWGVRVILDGQGGDELLGGYHSFFPVLFFDLFKTVRWRRLAQESRAYHLIHHHSPADSLFKVSLRFLPRQLRGEVSKILRLGGYRWLNRAFIGEFGSPRLAAGSDICPPRTGLFDRALLEALLVSSGPALLRYADRNSMAHSIQARLPFLDHRLVEFVSRIPQEQKIREGTTKYVLRNAMRGVLPEPVRARQDKMGFPTPQDAWLRALKDTVADIVWSRSFTGRIYFDTERVKKGFEDFCQGRSNIGGDIWRWINLELWMRRFID